MKESFHRTIIIFMINVFYQFFNLCYLILIIVNNV